VILVTGGGGYIGSHTVKALGEAGFRLVVFDDFSTGHRDFVRGVDVIEGDLGRMTDVQSVFDRHAIEGVVHFAGRALVGESSKRPELYYATNVVGGLNLLNAMRDAGVTNLIFSSTCATYGIPETENLGEDHPQRPINPYGETKLAFERAMAWFGSAHGIRHLSLRYFNAAGADAACEFGEDHAPETHLIPLVLGAAAGLRARVEIYGTDYPTPDGTCVRDYIHVTDIADAHVTGLQKLMAGTLEPQALNLGTGTGASVREVIDTVRAVTGRDFEVVESPRRRGDAPRLVALAERVAEVLGWRPAHSDLPNIVDTAWHWQLKRKKVSL
jgi:UDP-glucose-4-epimerase GalE